MTTYVYCQAMGDSATAPWHIRYWARLERRTLCGLNVKGDEKTPVTGLCLGVPLASCPDMVCRKCAAAYVNDRKQDEIPAGADKMRSSLRTVTQTP